jgi:hypothetical protein
MMLRAVKQVRAAFSMLSPDEILRHAKRPLHIGLVADSSAGYAELEDFLIPAGLSESAHVGIMQQIHRASDPGVPDKVDVILYEPGIPCPQGAVSFRRGEAELTVSEILREKADLALPLARQFPIFRKTMVDHLVDTVARENALFAIATALPNVVPTLIELPWTMGEFASDTLFLTANQVRMAFQIAAAYGAEAGFAAQKFEILTLAGGAFGWRALARELVSHIPLGGGLIPKGAIAYAGTFVAGKGLELLHQRNGSLTRQERRELYREGLTRGKAIVRVGQ